MAVGQVESEQFPYLPLTLIVPERSFAVMALLDIGFEGDVILPLDLLTSEHRVISAARSHSSAHR
jgi:hypothetical protein